MINRILCMFMLLFLGLASVFSESRELAVRLARLDSCIEQSETFDMKKEQRIASLRRAFDRASDPDERYKNSIALYEEYKSYKYDSAYAYADRSLSIAGTLGRKEYKMEAGSAMVFCLCSAGLYKEAFDVFNAIPFDGGMGDRYKLMYYKVATRLNYDISDYNHVSPYKEDYLRTGDRYTDSLLSLLPAGSSLRWLYVGQRQMKNGDYANSMSSFKKYLDSGVTDMHDMAIAVSSIGWMAWRQGDEEAAMCSLADAAVYDLLSSTKEITALCGLSELLYKYGDIKRATRYVQLALHSANFYGARQRKIEVGNILPIIEQSRNDMLTHQRNVMIGATVFCSVAILVILGLSVLTYKKNRKLKVAKSCIEQSNRKLAHANDSLKEANKIKTEYIGTSFCLNAMYMESMEKLYKTVDRKLLAGQYDDLRHMLKLSSLKKDRGDMFDNFDVTFLKIFPTFVEEYNGLFPEEERKAPGKGSSLTTEMRIFALIRLGVTDSERISRFLDKSVHTINTYKTRVKNKSSIPNELFEQKIMEIGNGSGEA